MIAHIKAKMIICAAFVIVISITCGAIFIFADGQDISGVTAEVEVYSGYIRYTRSTNVTYTRGSYCQADGTVVTGAGNAYWLSEYIDVEDISIFAVYSNSNYLTKVITYYCYFDENHNAISGGYNYNASSQRYCGYIPSNAKYLRYTIYTAASTTSNQVNVNWKLILVPDAVYNPPDTENTIAEYGQSNLSVKYFWTEPINISIVDNEVIFPYQADTYKKLFVKVNVYDESVYIENFSLQTTIWESVEHGIQQDYTYRHARIDTNDNSQPNIGLHYFYLDDNNRYVQVTPSRYLIDGYNPYTIYQETTSIENGRFNGYEMYIPLLDVEVSRQIKVSFDNCYFGDASIDLVLKARGVIDDLGNTANDLEVPLPTIDIADLIDTALEDVDLVSAKSIFSILYDDLIVKMLLIAVTFGLIGYILFGKKAE